VWLCTLFAWIYAVQVYHYRIDDTCYPCDCYDVGSHGRSCNISTGQCHCRSGVIGRRCDVCASRFAEVTLRGCEVVYDACPRSFYSGIWWKRTPFGSLARQDCPRRASGTAVRLCNGTVDGWLEPDLSDCISDAFVNLKSQVCTSSILSCDMFFLIPIAVACSS